MTSRWVTGITGAVAGVLLVTTLALTTGAVTQTGTEERMYFAADEVTVAVSGYTTLATLTNPKGRWDCLTVQAENSDATGTVDAFRVEVLPCPSCDWETFLSGTDFDSTTIGSLVFSSATGLHEIGTNGAAWAVIETPPVYQVRFSASAATGTAAVTVRGCWSEE